MGNQASKDTGDQVAFPGGQVLKKDLPRGVVSLICYGDGKGGKIGRFGQGLNEPNDAVLSLLKSKGLVDVAASMREEINNAKGRTVPTYCENAKDVVRKYKPQFEDRGVRVFYAKKYVLATRKHRFWFEYVDLDVVENKDYTIQDGLSSTASFDWV